MSLHYAVAAEKLERIVAAQAVDAHIAMDLDYAARCLRGAAGAGDPTGTSGDRPPAPSEIVAHQCHGTMRPYPPELCSVCKPSEAVGVMTLRELVTAFNHLGAVRPTPRAALTVERLAELLTEYYGVEHGEGNATQAAEWLLPRLVVPPTGSVTDMCPECGGLTTHVGKCSRWRAASPAAAPPPEEK